MTLALRRRQFLAASLGLPALGLPAKLLAATLGRGFTHGVASGDPAAESVILWTRYVGGGGDATPLGVEVAEDAEFGRIVTRAEAIASAEADHTAHVRVEGLRPAHWYYYRFRAPGGEVSPIGRTRTLPAEGVHPFRIAVFSCANLPFGFFNAYGHAASRNDIDLVVHLGDYLYEYPVGEYPTMEQAVPGRAIAPDTEIVQLADYHARYRSYRADPDLQRLHQLFPMISIWDDHEFANDAWKGGAENHQPGEGPWDARKAAAKRAYRDWLPMAEGPYAAYDIGDLATLIRLDTRVEGREEQISLARALAAAGSLPAAVAALSSGALIGEDRTLLGMAQERWLAEQLRRSTSAGKRWQLLAQQVVMGQTYTPAAVTEWIDPGAPVLVRDRVAAALALAKAGVPVNLDAWDGYPAARRRLLSTARQTDANLIVLAGDSHNSWAFDLAEGGAPAGVEFGVQSVTSPGYEAYFTRTDPAAVAAALKQSSPELRWADTAGRGYATVTLAPDEAVCEWTYVDTIRTRSTALSGSHRMAVQHGARMLST